MQHPTKVEGKSSIARFLRSFGPEAKIHLDALRQYEAFADRILQHHGEVQCIKILKEVNTRARHYAVGYPKGNRDFAGLWLKTSKKSCLPKALLLLEEAIDKCPNLALTIPNYVYTRQLQPSLDLSTITAESTATIGKQEMDDFDNYCRSHTPRLAPALGIPMLMTCKGGPNGPSAISQAQDLSALLCTQFYHPVRELLEITYGPQSWAVESIDNFSKECINTPETLIWRPNQPALLAKLEFLSGPAGKTRIVYVLNWWVQLALLPLHEAMMSHFKNMDGDATWDQKKAVGEIQQASLAGEELYSFDLSAATDRWPAKHQQIVMSAAFGTKVGKLWGEIMTGIAPYVKHEGRHVFYATGQPMGAFTSWPALNLSHHVTVRFLADELGVPPKYWVLGDDLVISGTSLALAYRKYMNSLGIAISEGKSISYERGKPHSAEFARNLVRDGNIISAVSPNLLNLVFDLGEQSMTIELIRELSDKFNLNVLISTNHALLPKQVERLLSRKALDNLLTVLCLPETIDIKLPIIRVDDSEIYARGETHVAHSNPYANIDSKSITTLYATKWRDQAVERLNQLNDLSNRMALQGKSAFSGYLLANQHHPIQRMVLNVNEELMKQFWKVESMSSAKPVPDTITTSIDLLIDVLTKGKSYRQWRDSRVVKTKALYKFAKQALKSAQESTARMNATLQEQRQSGQPTSWEELAKMHGL